MYKTLWTVQIHDLKTEKRYGYTLIYYHFGKKYSFPDKIREDKIYTIEFIKNAKLILTWDIFLKCLFKQKVFAI